MKTLNCAPFLKLGMLVFFLVALKVCVLHMHIHVAIVNKTAASFSA